MEVDLRCARLVCREWVQMAGSAVTVLRPLAFHPAALPELFPSLSQLDLSMVAKDVTPAGLASLSPLALLRALVIKKWRCAAAEPAGTMRLVELWDCPAP